MKHSTSTRVLALTLVKGDPRILIPMKRVRKRRIRKVEKRALPGGKRKVCDKDWQHTIAREFEEETCCKINNVKRFKYIGTVSIYYSRLKRMKHQRIYAIALSKQERKSCKNTNEMRDCRSFRFDQLPLGNMSLHYQNWLLSYLVAAAYEMFGTKIHANVHA